MLFEASALGEQQVVLVPHEALKGLVPNLGIHLYLAYMNQALPDLVWVVPLAIVP